MPTAWTAAPNLEALAQRREIREGLMPWPLVARKLERKLKRRGLYRQPVTPHQCSAIHQIAMRKIRRAMAELEGEFREQA